MNYSVLMSVYVKERPDYLRQAMESIRTQTVPTDDFVLVCDGPLNDELDIVIKEEQQKFGNVLHVKRLQENGGLGRALNEGLKICKNEIIARMDSDDLSRPDRCEKQLRLFMTIPDLDFSSGTVSEFESDPDNCTGKRALPITYEEIKRYSRKRNPMNHPCVMFRKTSVISSGGYRETFHLFEDYYLWIRMLMKRIDWMKKNLKKIYGKVEELPREYQHYFKPVYFHEGQDDQLLQLAMEKRDVIEEEIHLCGYFCIFTSRKMTAKDALELYKRRDESEKLFKGDKSYLGNSVVRVQSDEAADAKIFIEFVALVIRNKIYTSLKDAVLEDDSRANYMNVPAAIKELEKIEMIRQNSGEYRLDHAVTATQKAILKAFQMDAAYIQKEAAKIREALLKAVAYGCSEGFF